MENVTKKLDKVSPPWIVGALVLLALAIAVGISALVTRTQRRLPVQVCEGAQAVVRRAAQWSTSAQQDNHAVLRLVHVNYAIAQINALRVILSDYDIERITSVKPKEMIAALREQQSQAIRKVSESCAGLQLKGVQGNVTGWR